MASSDISGEALSYINGTIASLGMLDTGVERIYFITSFSYASNRNGLSTEISPDIKSKLIVPQSNSLSGEYGLNLYTADFVLMP